MSSDWTLSLPSVVVFVIGLGALAGAVLAILKLWRAIVPDMDTLMQREIAGIHEDLQEIRAKVFELEREITRIDQPSIVRRFDGIESKIDRLYDLIIERLAKV
jgi:DNA polymerase III delta prime subunit